MEGNMNDSITDLIKEAIQMFQDRSREEADLIYAVAKLSDIEKAALLAAYRLIYEEQNERTS